MIRFRARLAPTPGGVGAYVAVPAIVARELGLKGASKITAVIAGIPYRGSLRAMGGGAFGLGVLKAIREQARIDAGDEVVVDLELDTEARTVAVPQDLAKALARDKRAAAAWEALSFTNKKEMAGSLEEAKKPETRERRLQAALKKLGTR